MLKRLALYIAPKTRKPFYGFACNWRWFRRALGGKWENWILDQPIGGEHWFQAVPGQSRPHPLCRGTPTVEDYEPHGTRTEDYEPHGTCTEPRAVCRAYEEDPCITDDFGEPKGQCARCGYDREDHEDLYPNLRRAVEADDSIRPQLALLQYLSDHGYTICRKNPDGAWMPRTITPFMWVYAVNGLDPAKVKEEAFALYRETRRMEGDEEVDG